METIEQKVKDLTREELEKFCIDQNCKLGELTVKILEYEK